MNLILRTIGIYLNTLGTLFPKLAGRHGAYLFCFTPRPKMNQRFVAYLEKATIDTLEVDEDLIKLYQWGHGPQKILLIHGWSSHSYRWKKYIDVLDLTQFTVYAIDNPGHGLSSGRQFNLPKMGTVINRVLESIGPIDFMMGHSIGAFACLFALHEYPHHKVSNLILLAPAGNVTDWMDQYNKKMKLSKKNMQHILDHFFDLFGYTLDYFVAANFAAKLNIPGLIIHDRQDKDTSATYSQQIHDAWPKSQLILTEGKGHKLNQPDIIERIRLYLASTVSKTETPREV